MDHTINHHLAQACIADLRHHAQRDTLARAARGPARRYADLVIRPHAEGVGLLEFASLDTAREAGRAAARQALERASASLVA